MIEVRINGEMTSIDEGLNIGSLLDKLDVRGHTLMVERNGEILKRERFNDVVIVKGDVLELIRLTGGG